MNIPAQLPDDVKEILENSSDTKFQKFVLGLPFASSTTDILDLKRAQVVLDQNHYGLKVVKDRILEYLATLILNQRQASKFHAPILSLVGLVGSGKTSLAYSIAQSLGRKIIRIPFGGLGTTAQLKGRAKGLPEAEPSILMKELIKAGVNNPVVLLDEIDRVATEARVDIMGVLVELLDPEQNSAFVDYYLDFPFDLSRVLFVTTANNTSNIATAVLDRLELIEMPSYTDDEKIMIAKNYLLPKAMAEAGLPKDTINIEDGLWPQIVRPLGFDGGIRSLQRSIQTLTRKIAREIVEGKVGPYLIRSDNLNFYI